VSGTLSDCDSDGDSDGENASTLFEGFSICEAASAGKLKTATRRKNFIESIPLKYTTAIAPIPIAADVKFKRQGNVLP
jgi:hypothetical protein